MSCVAQGSRVWIQGFRPWMNKSRLCETNFLSCSMARIIEAHLQLS